MGCSIDGWSQQADHFIYLQSDTKLPFYVKLGATASPLTSSSSGYLILPKVPQGAFSLWVGFPDSAYPEQHFVCSINGDKGYLLKRFPEKGWALYDLQELTLTYANRPDSTGAVPDTMGKTAAQAPATGSVTTQTPAATTAPAQDHSLDTAGQAQTPAQVPAATAATAQVVTATQTPATVPTGAGGQDTALPVVPKEADAFGDALVAVTKDSTLRNIKMVKKAPVEPVVLPSGGPAAIVLVSRQVTDTAVQLVYTDRQASGAVDTVQVLMQQGSGATPAPGGTSPATDSQAVHQAVVNPLPGTQDSARSSGIPTGNTVSGDQGTTATPPVAAAVVAPVDTSHAFNPTTAVRGGKVKDTSNYVVPVFKQDSGANQGAQTDTSKGSLAAGFGVQPATQAAAPAGAPKGLVLSNSNCNHVAGDDDYLRLRKRMASESDVDRMIELSRKAFKKSCFTTEQIRNLSFLFLQEDGRYKFIEEAYPFASDSYNFKSLQGLFSSVYFINRFKALVER